MTTMDAFVINDHAYVKACAENFKRYAMSIDIRKRIRDSQRYLRSLGLIPSPPPSITQPSSPVATQPEQKTTKRNTNARADVLALIAEHGPLTAGEVAAHLGRSSVWATNLLSRMRDVLHIVGNKRNERHYFVQVYHTDPTYVYVSPEPPKPADPIVEAKRPARIPSIAAVDRGLALIDQYFHEDARGKAVFERLCLRPQSVPELEAALKMNDATIRLALQRMIQIGAVCKEEKESVFDQLQRRHVRQVYAVKEVQS